MTVWRTTTGAVAVAVGLTAAAAPTAAAPPSTCTAGQLHLSASSYGAAAQQFVQTFTATNTSASACRLAGWPTMRLRKASGKTAPAPSIRVVQGRSASHPYSTVTLQAGRAASFDVYGADFDAADNKPCSQARIVEVALPGVSPLPVAVTLPYCTAFYVAPLIAGKTDREFYSAIWAKRWCRIEQFAVTFGPRISEATGQHTVALRLINRGPTCTLFGAPALWFEDAHGFIPFEWGTGHDQMIAAHSHATAIKVRAGRDAWVVINHYRCDLGDKRSASTVLIGLVPANSADTVRVRIPDPYEHLAYCGKGDPGSTITVSQFVLTLSAAFHRR